MRRTHRVRRGTSLQRRDRTAGDSSPVTQENGRLRGRPKPRPPSPKSVPPKRPPEASAKTSPKPSPTVPQPPADPAVPSRTPSCPCSSRSGRNGCAGNARSSTMRRGTGRKRGTPQFHCQWSIPRERPSCAGSATGAPTDSRRTPPAPLLGTDAALTSVLTAKGPADPSRGALRSAPTAPQSPAGATSPPSPAARRRSHRRPRGRPAWRTSRPSGRRRSTRGRTSVSSRCVRR